MTFSTLTPKCLTFLTFYMLLLLFEPFESCRHVTLKKWERSYVNFPKVARVGNFNKVIFPLPARNFCMARKVTFG